MALRYKMDSAVTAVLVRDFYEYECHISNQPFVAYAVGTPGRVYEVSRYDEIKYFLPDYLDENLIDLSFPVKPHEWRLAEAPQWLFSHVEIIDNLLNQDSTQWEYRYRLASGRAYYSRVTGYRGRVIWHCGLSRDDLKQPRIIPSGTQIIVERRRK